jgi:Skp family chaperone for outer membrane proteins
MTKSTETPATAPGIDLQPIIEKVFEEIKAAEAEVSAKNAELQAAREKLAAARGKLEMIGQLQQMVATTGQAQP